MAMADQELKDLVASLAVSQKETDKMQKETDRQIQDLGKEIEKTGKQIKETAAQLKETDRVLKGMGVTQGDISEDIVYENFERIFRSHGERLDVDRNIVLRGAGKKPLGEYDIVGVNGNKVFVGETKTRLTKGHVSNFVEKKLPAFRKYSDYKDYEIYGVLGARVLGEDVKKEVLKQGLYLIKETHDGDAEMLNPKGFVARGF